MIPSQSGSGVTVVVPVYYGRDFVGRALASVRAQTMKEFPVQLVVVEDGTPPQARSDQIARQYEAEYHLLESNQGVAKARKFGADQSRFAQGYLAFLDQDDRWYPQFLEVMISRLRKTHAAYAVANMDMVTDEGETYRLYQTKRPSLTLSDLKMFNHIVSPSQVLMQLYAFRQIPWPGHLQSPGADDWLLWLMLLSQGLGATYVPEALVAYLDHAAGAHRNIPVMRQSEASVVNDWFPRLGFSVFDRRRYWALVELNQALALRHQSGWITAGRHLARQFRRDAPAALSALWYRLERKIKHLV